MKRISKALVYGINRYQKDFEYMFPQTKIIAYITNKKNNKEYNEKKCYSVNEMPDKLKKYTLIICDRKNKKTDEIIKKLNFKNSFYLEDIGCLLDDKIDEYTNLKMSKTIYYWNCLNAKKNSEYFKEMIYTDSIDNIKCEYPFKYAQIQPGGFVYTCCMGWTNTSIGNILLKSPKKVWNSNLAKLHRLSIINKTYFFCDKDKCPYMNKKTIKTDTRFENLKVFDTPNEISISIDRSCNLKCPSCRNEFCNEKGKKLILSKYFSKKLIKSNWLNKTNDLIMSSQGEVFFSEVYKKMIFESKIIKRDSITIHTNGTLLTKKNLDKLCSIYNKINFYISVDAATKETYEKIRYGGNFNKLISNLEYLSKIKNETQKIGIVNLLFVVQKDNYKEMIDFVKMGKKFKFDMITFSKIDNWGTYDNFDEISMFDNNGKPKKELQEIIVDPIFKDKIVNINNVTQ